MALSDETRAVAVVTSFTQLLDNRLERPMYDLADDAMMDWFGRTIRGRSAILRFINTQLPGSQLVVEEVTSVPALTHRLLSTGKSVAPIIKEPSVIERSSNEEGDGRKTPDNPISMNYEELVRAPRARRHLMTKLGLGEDWQFVEVRGKMVYEQQYFDGSSDFVDKHFKRLVLGYTDYIYLIVYEGESLCKKKLLPLFKQ